MLSHHAPLGESPALTFYSFAHASSQPPRLDHDRLYASLLDLTSLYTQSSANNNHLSVGYHFSFVWSLLDPVSGPLKVSDKFLARVIQSLFAADGVTLRPAAEFESNLSVAQLFRVAFKLADTSGLDEASVAVLRQVSGGSTLEAPRIAFKFFYMFWTAKTGDTAEFDLLQANIDLLSFHVRLLHEKFFADEQKTINLELGSEGGLQQLRNSCIELVVRLIRAYKNGYKEHVLLKR